MMPREIGVTELALRDAHQSLMATRMAIEDMIPVCEQIDRAGFWSVECWGGGATFDTCIRFLNEDPWERLRTFRKLMPNSRLQMLLRGQNLLGYRHYQDEVVERFVAKAAENGMDVFRVFDALNDPRNLEHAMNAVTKVGKHAQGTICYTVSPLHNTEGYVQLAGRLLDMGAQSIALKDMAALLKPQPAYDIVKGIKDTYGADTQVNVHCHATTGGDPGLADEGDRGRRRCRRHRGLLDVAGPGPQPDRVVGGDARGHRLHHRRRPGHAAAGARSLRQGPPEVLRFRVQDHHRGHQHLQVPDPPRRDDLEHGVPAEEPAPATGSRK